MKLRGDTIQFIKYVVGNGRNVNIWYDNWHNLGPLKARFGARVIYDAASSNSATMSDYVGDHGWNKPMPISNELIQMLDTWPQYQPRIDMDDRVEWVLNANKEYTVKSAWNAIRRVGTVATWHKVVWHRDAIPRCSFIMWLVCRNRIRTRDRLKRWGVIDDSTCVLCGNGEETRDHLFFNCSFSGYVWSCVLKRNQLGYRCNSWQEELNMAEQYYKGSAMIARIGRLTMGVTLYCLWQERNTRIFQNAIRNEEAVLIDIQNYVIAKTWYWRVDRKYINWLICKGWGINERILV